MELSCGNLSEFKNDALGSAPERAGVEVHLPHVQL
jgi:hypothetical protein